MTERKSESAPPERREPEEQDAHAGRGGGGDSGGGPYPNPHKGKDPKKDGYMGTGGQTEMPYHGHGQLGEEEVGDEANANAPAKRG